MKTYEFESRSEWTSLKETLPDDIYNAVKRLYSFFDGRKMIDWFAGLYDSERGAFYYANSARDTEGYLPDVESTLQSYGAVCDLGAIKNLDAEIPNGIKRRTVDFVKGLQSAEDGYFFHPQWPVGRENLASDRYGRDVGTSTQIISWFKIDEGDGIPKRQYPRFCAPNGVKCERHAGTDGCCFARPSAAKTDKSAASPKGNSLEHPDYTSPEAFSTWLEKFNATVKENSGRAQHLAALRATIVANGYNDIVLDHLDRTLTEAYDEQCAAGLEPTGAWQSSFDYNLIWGVHKYLGGYYNDLKIGRPLPKKCIPHMVRACIKVASLPPNGNYRMNDIWNQWASLGDILTNVERHYHNDERTRLKQQVHAIIRESASELIDITIEKLTPFKIEDGSFSYLSSGKSMTTTFSVPIALGVHEGDANATSMAYHLYYAMLDALGIDRIKICTEEDGRYFVEKLVSAKPIQKKR